MLRVTNTVFDTVLHPEFGDLHYKLATYFEETTDHLIRTVMQSDGNDEDIPSNQSAITRKSRKASTGRHTGRLRNIYSSELFRFPDPPLVLMAHYLNNIASSKITERFIDLHLFEKKNLSYKIKGLSRFGSVCKL